MPELQQFPLMTTSGRRGRVFRTSRFLDRSEHTRVTFDDGTEMTVPSESIRPQADGSFLLDEEFLVTETKPSEREVVESPHSEDVSSDQPEPERISATSGEEGAVMLDEPLYYEDVEVERVPVNRIIEGPVETRQEGDVLIVPVVEEVVTVQKRLLLKEEVRIRRRRTEVREPRRVVVRDGEIRVIGADGRPIQT